MVKLSGSDIETINLFEKRAGCSVRDCFTKDDEITFIVKKGDIGAAIGKGGIKIKKLKEEFKKEIHVYEYSDDVAQFIKNLFYPLKIEKVEIEDKNAKVYIDSKLKKRAIGGEGKKIKNVKDIVCRHFSIDNITIV
ncbi:MAG: NusA-like transcription termination signal-binding factor [Candidatus Micrarchaeota archaeon]